MKFLIIIFVFLNVVACKNETVNPTKGDIVEAVYGLGIIKSDNTYHAKSAIVLSVKELFVSEGQDVKKGQKLFITDQGSVFHAPFDGKITDIPIVIGENLFPQSLILSLIDLQNLYLEVSLEQQAAMRLKKGVRAEITFEFFRNDKIIGQITSIYPKNDQFVAKVESNKWPAGILPGMSADVAFEVARKQNVVLVPTKAIANGHIVILRNNKKEKLAVQLGLADEEKTEILSPRLSPSDEIILP